MMKRGRTTRTCLMGVLLGLCITGCKQSSGYLSKLTPEMAHYQMTTNPESIAVRLMAPRRMPMNHQIVQRVAHVHPSQMVARGSAVSLSAPVVRVSRKAEVRTASAWRPLPTGSKTVAPQLVSREDLMRMTGGSPQVGRPLYQRQPRQPRPGLFQRRRMIVLADKKKELPMPKKETKSKESGPVPIPGARTFSKRPFFGGPNHVAPREGTKVALPPYVVEPPDILLVELSRKLPDTEQPIGGQHLVRPDGTISLGVYGSTYVAGMTLDQARYAIYNTLRRSIKGSPEDPFKPNELYVDVLAYNSKVYYVITDGGGAGEQVYRVPATGNETVLDALAQINGLPAVASKKRIWLDRSNAGKHAAPQILPIDWRAITQHASPQTNYQIYPGDRIYVAADPKITIDTFIAKVLSPIERLFGITLLGSTTVNSIKGVNLGGGGGIR